MATAHTPGRACSSLLNSQPWLLNSVYCFVTRTKHAFSWGQLPHMHANITALWEIESAASRQRAAQVIFSMRGQRSVLKTGQMSQRRRTAWMSGAQGAG